MRLSVGAKLISVIVLAILLVLIAGTAGFFELRRLGQQTARLSSSAQANQYAHVIRLDLAEMHKALVEGLSRQDSVWLDRPLEQPRQNIETNAANLIRLLNEQGNTARANEIAAILTTLNIEVNKMVALAENGEWNTAYLSLANQVEPIEAQMITQVGEIDLNLSQEVNAASTAVVETQRSTLLNLVLIICGAVLLLGLAGWLLWRNLVTSIRQLTDIAGMLARGNLEVRTPISARRDELGTLAYAFNTMADELAASHHNLTQQVDTRTAELQSERAALQQTLADLQSSIADREELLSTLEQLQNPVIPVIDGVVVAPVVGQLTNRRIEQLRATLLEIVATSGARVALLDITGVPVLDDRAAAGLIQTSQALQLLGANAILVGIRPEVAQSLVNMGNDSKDMATTVDLQRGVDLALHLLRRRIVPLESTKGNAHKKPIA
jgi:anti-anti-sigma regulatory factor/HAMP domain-containing protein